MPRLTRVLLWIVTALLLFALAVLASIVIDTLLGRGEIDALHFLRRAGAFRDPSPLPCVLPANDDHAALPPARGPAGAAQTREEAQP